MVLVMGGTMTVLGDRHSLSAQLGCGSVSWRSARQRHHRPGPCSRRFGYSQHVTRWLGCRLGSFGRTRGPGYIDEPDCVTGRSSTTSVFDAGAQYTFELGHEAGMCKGVVDVKAGWCLDRVCAGNCPITH